MSFQKNVGIEQKTYGSSRNDHSCNPLVMKFIIAPGRQSFDAIALLVYYKLNNRATNGKTAQMTRKI